MKICVLSYYFGPKLGVGNYLDSLLPIFNQDIHGEIYLVVNNNFLNKSNFITFPKVKVINNKWLNYGTIPSLIYLYLFFPFFLRKNKIQLLILPTNPVIGFLMPCKVLSVIHDINEYEIKNKYGILHTFFRKKIYIERTLKKSDNIVVISHFVLNQIKVKLKKLSEKVIEKIVVIHNGVEFFNVDHLTKSIKKEEYFISVGRIDPESKNLYFLLDLFLHLKKSEEFKNYKLFVIGGINKTSQESSEKFIQKINKIQDVKYLGFISDQELKQYYQKAQACLLMSKFEGFGLPLLEAYSNSCKVIRHKDNKVFDEISGGLDYKVSDSYTKNMQLVQEIKNYLEKEIEFENHLNKFSWEKARGKYIDLINNIISIK